MSADPLLLTYGAAGAKLSLSARTIRRLVDAGDLPVVRIGGAVRIAQADLEAYISGNRKCRTDAQIPINGGSPTRRQVVVEFANLLEQRLRPKQKPLRQKGA